MTKPRGAKQILDSMIKTLQHTPGLDLHNGSVLQSILGAISLEMESIEQRCLGYAGIDRSVDPYPYGSYSVEGFAPTEQLSKQPPTRAPAEAPWGTTEGNNNDEESNDS